MKKKALRSSHSASRDPKGTKLTSSAQKGECVLPRKIGSFQTVNLPVSLHRTDGPRISAGFIRARACVRACVHACGRVSL